MTDSPAAPETEEARSQKPEPEEKPIVATLALKNVKGGSVRVYGKSGKRYQFSRSPRHKGLVLEFTSLAEFHRIEADIRGVRMGQHEIVTLMGVSDPVNAAEEAVRGLIGAARQVPLDRRAEALVKLAAIIEEGLRAIDEARALGAELDTETVGQGDKEPVTPKAPEPVTLRSDQWVDEDGHPMPEDKPAQERLTPEKEQVRELAAAAEQNGGKTHADLMQMPWNDFKALAAQKGVEVGKLKKGDLATAFLEAQAKGFPDTRKEGQ